MWLHNCDNCGVEDIADNFKECCQKWLCPNCNDNIHPDSYCCRKSY
jgi:hypothetical protein